MDRRDFIKTLCATAAMLPASRLTAAAAPAAKPENNVSSSPGQVSRRRYKNSDLTLPMLGFGMMRLPRKNYGIDMDELSRQVEIAIKSGVNYFDTAYFYHGGQSEVAAGKILSKYPRSSYMLADKMPVSRVRNAADLERIWQEQLKRCQVKYFDFYLLHALNAASWKKAKRLKVYEFLKKKKDEGKIRHLGFSFHDSPEVLREIAKSYPWDFAQIQLNYLDWELYRSREQYEILTGLNIPVIVMEPLRGGALATVNAEAQQIFKRSDPEKSVASWAFRYVGSLPNVLITLSGMTKTEHLEENIRTFTNFTPLSEQERRTLATALSAYQKSGIIPCTACRYCMPCPVGVNIPAIFRMHNDARISGSQSRAKHRYKRLSAKEQGSNCISCNRCTRRCPQKISIPTELKKIDAALKR